MKDKVEEMEENERQIRRMLDDANLLSEGYIKRIKELEAQRIALATDVATLEEEVMVTRKHAAERFDLARQKQDIECRLQKTEKSLKELTDETKDLKERSKTFNEISNRNHELEQKSKSLEEQINLLSQKFSREVSEKNDLEKIRQLQDKAIRELYENEKYLKQSLEKVTKEYSDYKMEAEAYSKKMNLNTVELKNSFKKIKKENDKLSSDNEKLIGDVSRLLQTINQK